MRDLQLKFINVRLAFHKTILALHGSLEHITLQPCHPPRSFLWTPTLLQGRFQPHCTECTTAIHSYFIPLQIHKQAQLQLFFWTGTATNVYKEIELKQCEQKECALVGLNLSKANFHPHLSHFTSFVSVKHLFRHYYIKQTYLKVKASPTDLCRLAQVAGLKLTIEHKMVIPALWDLHSGTHQGRDAP